MSSLLSASMTRSEGRAAAYMAASVTATSVFPVPPKPEPTVITPDLSEGSRMPATVWRRHSAVFSSLARSRLPGGTTRPCRSARRDMAPLTASLAGPHPPQQANGPLLGVVRGYAPLSRPGAPQPLPGRRGGRPPSGRRLPFLAAVGALVAVGLIVAWMGQRADAVARARPGITW